METRALDLNDYQLVTRPALQPAQSVVGATPRRSVSAPV
jgi:hypothetical protein